MTRLFISLYFAITFGLVIINLSGEWLWQLLSESESQAPSKVEQSITNMVSVYQHVYKSTYQAQGATQAQQTLRELLEAQPLTYSIEPSVNFAFLTEQQIALNAMQPLFLYVSETTAEVYIPLDEQQILVLGPIAIAEPIAQASWLAMTLKLLAYGLLALLILAWSYPLWRDLNTLKGYTHRISSGDLDIKNKLKPHSIVFPLGLAFENMARRIRELLDFQKQMMQAVSHDIRTPLARLKFSLAIDAHSESSKANMLTDISEIEQLVEGMLTYGRLESAEPDLNIERVNMYELASNLIEKLNRNTHKSYDDNLADNEVIKINLNCPESLTWECDGYLIERALQNLLTNAQRHATSTVLLTLEVKNKSLVMTVADDGCGIPEDQMERIFTPFARIDSSRNKNSGGFGLGLAIVNKITHWHDGHITVKNSTCFESGESKTTGATFIISL